MNTKLITELFLVNITEKQIGSTLLWYDQSENKINKNISYLIFFTLVKKPENREEKKQK